MACGVGPAAGKLAPQNDLFVSQKGPRARQGKPPPQSRAVEKFFTFLTLVASIPDAMAHAVDRQTPGGPHWALLRVATDPPTSGVFSAPSPQTISPHSGPCGGHCASRGIYLIFPQWDLGGDFALFVSGFFLRAVAHCAFAGPLWCFPWRPCGNLDCTVGHVINAIAQCHATPRLCCSFANCLPLVETLQVFLGTPLSPPWGSTAPRSSLLWGISPRICLHLARNAQKLSHQPLINPRHFFLLRRGQQQLFLFFFFATATATLPKLCFPRPAPLCLIAPRHFTVLLFR